MKYIVAMDSFKGSLSSEEAGNAVAGNIRKRDNEADIQIFSMSDGGDGMLSAKPREPSAFLCQLAMP